MEAYPQEFRERVMDAVRSGEFTQEEVAEIFQVTDRSIRYWQRQEEETGSLAPKPHAGGAGPAIHGEAERRLKDFVLGHPDATLDEIKAALGLSISPKTICTTLQRMKLTRKKKVRRAAERDDPEVRAKREEWRRKTEDVDAARMVVVDQTGVSTQMHRAFGRGPEGERVVGTVPERHYESATLMGGMRLDGSVAALVYDGGTDVAAALSFVKTQLARLLKAGDIVIWDNLSAHKSPEVIAAVQGCGAEVWLLPPYSPDLNPIELLWSKVKTALRGFAARTKKTLIEAVGKAFRTIVKSDIAHWFQHAGYRKTQR